MAEENARRPLPSLRRYLLLWIGGCAVVMVLAYTQLLDYYVALGIEIRTQSFLERTAQDYLEDLGEGVQAPLPGGRSLAGYLDLADIPTQILGAFELQDLQHGEPLRFVNLDIEPDGSKEFAVDTGDFCVEGICELLFLYPYRLNADEWLYLVHGVIGSDEIYEELEFTERVAVGIGGLFAVLLLLVSAVLIRNVAAPVRKLNTWSAALSAENADLEVPSLRFRELDALAIRIRHAFQRVRESVDKEKRFLRHASHELRTPISILANNVELIDRLGDRPDRSDAEQAAFARQYRALEDVQLLMETLLWVNRQTESLPKSEKIDLRRELEGIVEGYQYLLDKRSVSLSVDGSGEAHAPAAAVRIVLSNLVRNAFQYTVDGDVLISVEDAEVRIGNSSAPKAESEAVTSTETGVGAGTRTDDEEYGFGLGLELVSLICKRLNWHYTTAELPAGRVTMVRF